MDSILERAGLADISEKVFAAQRLTDDDALRLYAVRDLNALGYLANHVRERKNGNVATYVLNLYLNYSNVCILSCQFCAFARRPHEKEGQFTYDIEEMARQTKEASDRGITEVHIVGGLHPKLPFSYYTEMIRALKAASPDLCVKAFTAIEIRHLAERIAKKPIRETLELLREAGLDSLTGGGAEIFDPGVRDQICRGKESAEEWLEVHRTWHRMGRRSTCTMLYGHVETPAHRVDHLRRLRELQDETGGFTALVPFAFEPEHNKLERLGRVSAFEDLRNLAVARLYLDIFDHITAYWISLGLPLAQVALSFGVDDLHGTIQQEKIFHMAGSKTPQGQTVATLERAIREAGRIPVQRNTFYEQLNGHKASAALQPDAALP
ncbi:MAG: aminofutalosine synthase MqnE [Methylacidiphilales bacterium]|nr:aminofutalosine synthase MqnE [Candidatus Methylacidiphilales bacterium]